MSYLYAVQMNIPDYAFAPIKLGFSVEPTRRVKEFTRGPFPAVWLGEWPAPEGRANEKAAHDRFAAYRLTGEWFYPAPELLDFVNGSTKTETRALTSEKKVALFQQRYARLFPAPTVPERQPLPDPFDLSDLIQPARLAAIDRVKSLWPRMAMGTQYFRRSQLAGLTGLSEEMIEGYVDLRFQVGSTIRYGLRGILDLLDRHPEYAEGIAAHMEQYKELAA